VHKIKLSKLYEMQKLNPLENLKQYRVVKLSTRLGSAATAKALASVVKVFKKKQKKGTKEGILLALFFNPR